ncbi:embryo-abundant protein, putative (macronuclear) [Tetrahymena thermophila SB210]|uniref:Embryo-abundant protein, putative n=1 Tax=Tetrahymena thermophila (strain SB210) TaxID=312017 RepID=I7M0Y7_TETTS|nr:embryo-abundant protein, putative [Tetrahymena thermophila SB210]EAR92954.1 embryo-abundant protein, putative [Tetrahymena thermophila SB210]|eukprot:XP_001013199.1 embryo-abundant protein, putative [Tetrahymena thermophila SB210]
MLPAQQKDLFGHSNQGENYDKFRPVYPQEFFDQILKHAVDRENFVDIACGTGQLLFELSNHFKFSLGTDISPKQIEVTNQKIQKKNLQDRVKAIVCDAHSLSKISTEQGLPSKYDLITIGQALHWFDTQEFFTEVSRNIMKQNHSSIFAVTGYFCRGFDYIVGENNFEEDQTVYNEFYDKVKEHFDCDRENLSLGYVGYDFSKEFKEIENVQTVTNTPCSIFEMVKYLKTYSAYNTLLEKNKNNTNFIDPVIKFEEDVTKKVQEIQKTSQFQSQNPIRMKTSYFLRIFKKL